MTERMSFFNFTVEQWAMGVGALVPVVVSCVGVWKDRRDQAKTASMPQKERLLRPPGHSLSTQLEEAADSLLFQMLIACGACGFAGLAIGLAVRWWAQSVPIAWALGATVPAVGLAALGIWRIQCLFKLTEEMRRLRLGMRGEQAVAEALQELAAFGYRSFHDVPGQEISLSKAPWNIDHKGVRDDY